MSDQDDPFSNNGRTVIRPRPGGAAPGVGASQGGFGSSPFGSGYPSGNPQQPSSGARGSPADWAFDYPGTGSEPQRVAPSRKIPLQVALNSTIGRDVKASNPITQAAMPLLSLLGRLRLGVVEMDAMPLMRHVNASIIQFEKTLLGAGIDPEQVRTAKYALCATADDIVQNLPGDKHIWLQYSMLAQFFNERTSGTGFFEYIRRLTNNPSVYYNLLELIHACLSLGFEGQYRSMAGGDIELQRVRRDVFLTLRNVKPQGMGELSPRWRGMQLNLRRFRDGIPLWVIGALLLSLLAVAYIFLRYLSGNAGELASESLLRLHPPELVTIARASPEPVTPVVKQVTPQELTQLERIRKVLAPEIAENLIAVEPIGQQIVIRVSNLLLFASGSADAKPEFESLVERIASALNKEPGGIFIVGHTDKTRLRATSPFKSNFDLSVRRAQSVADMISPKLGDPKRVQVSGKGDTQPIASEKTEAGKSQNRRVEISIPTEESL